MIEYRRELLERLHTICSCSEDSKHIVLPPGTILPDGVSGTQHYNHIFIWFWALCREHEHPFDSQTTRSLAGLPFRKILSGGPILHGSPRDNLPAELRDKIFRKGKCPIPGCTNTEDVRILGHGENEIVAEPFVPLRDGFRLRNNQYSRDAKCACGAQIRMIMIRGRNQNRGY